MQKSNVTMFYNLRHNKNISIISKENDGDISPSLKNNKSNTIVTMVNSLDSYKKWEDIVGTGRILPAFPGAGGSKEYAYVKRMKACGCKVKNAV